MSQQVDGGAFAWFCPLCGRQVPHRVRLCRCGYEQGGRVPPFAPFPGPHVSPGRRGVPWALVWGGISAILLVVLAVQWSPRDTTPPGSVSDAFWDPGVSETPGDVPQLEFTPAPVPVARPPVAMMPAPPAPGVPLTRPAFAGALPSLEEVIGAAIPAVVSIQSSAGRGTGFFAAPGVVVSNDHVISGNRSVTLKGPAGSMRARVAKVAPDFDLAILHVDNPGVSQPILPLGSATTARVGQEVIAIGFALGLLENTVTRGIVSGIRTAGPATYVQTDAAINPGNSGGPLIDRHGMVIGIATLKFGDNAESLGFAVAVDHVKPLLNNSSTEPPRPAAGPATNTELSSLLDHSAPSTADRRRSAGQAAFEETLREIAVRASRTDDFWDRYKASCLGGQRPGGSYDREWFSVYENRVPDGRGVPGCARWLGDLNEMAGRVRAAMKEAEEAARRLGVYPGVRRDLRRRYRLDWRGWER